MKRVIPFIFIIALMGGCKEETVSGDDCGDDIIDTGEECDGNALGGAGCIGLGYYGGTLECSSDCRFDVADCEGFGQCGDGVLHQAFGEECDGATLGTATCEDMGLGSGVLACNSICRYDTSGCELGGSCGDGVIDDREQCEANNLGGASCSSLGLGEGNLSCTNVCTLDVSGCETQPECGDGVLVSPVEECEGSDVGGTTCEDLGYLTGTLACSASVCKYNISGCSNSLLCGNDSVEPNEECDGDNLNSQTCESLGYRAGVLSCTDGCFFDVTDCESNGYCGDGVIDTEFEVCDGTNLGGETCMSQGGHSGGALVCGDDCNSFDTSGCTNLASCQGNGVDPGEECDGTDFDGVTCQSLGFFGGSLTCTQGCLIDASGCFSMVKLANGAEHTCALDDHGRIWCWGSNTHGQMGTSSVPMDSNAHTVPTLVDHSMLLTGERFVDLSSGGFFTCALTSADNLYCWGDGANGAVDGVSVTEFPLPTQITLPAGVTPMTIASGMYHSCILSSARELWCWGLDDNYQLGFSAAPDDFSAFLIPVPLPGDVVETRGFDGANAATCALGTDGVVRCWGYNGLGTLGRGFSDEEAYEAAVAIDESGIPAGTQFASVATGWLNGCALTATGEAYCWGANHNGELGLGYTGPTGNLGGVPTPGAVVGGYIFSQIETGHDITCGVETSGLVYCWGRGDAGLLGNGDLGLTLSATPVPTAPLFAQVFTQVAISPGEVAHVCALNDDGAPYCWGDNNNGQLGNTDLSTTARPTPVQVP